MKKIRKSTFYKNKKIDNTGDIDVNNILVSKKESCGTKNSYKYFIGHKTVMYKAPTNDWIC